MLESYPWACVEAMKTWQGKQMKICIKIQTHFHKCEKVQENES